MRYASLASGSKGNCHAISDGCQTLLVDAGISFLQIRKGLEGLSWRLDQVRGVAITHEHTDHIRAVPMIVKKTDWDILATPITKEATEAITGIEIPSSRWVPLQAGLAKGWGGWQLRPFAISHDTDDPVGYRIEAQGANLAVMTDLGYPTKLAIEYAKDLDFFALESNHDVAMLREGTYPAELKRRILSRVGHLSNDACAEFLAEVISPRLKNIVLTHLSEQNNAPALARLASTSAVSQIGKGTELHVAPQTGALEVIAAGG